MLLQPLHGLGARVVGQLGQRRDLAAEKRLATRAHGADDASRADGDAPARA